MEVLEVLLEDGKIIKNKSNDFLIVKDFISKKNILYINSFFIKRKLKYVSEVKVITSNLESILFKNFNGKFIEVEKELDMEKIKKDVLNIYKEYEIEKINENFIILTSKKKEKRKIIKFDGTVGNKFIIKNLFNTINKKYILKGKQNKIINDNCLNCKYFVNNICIAIDKEGSLNETKCKNPILYRKLIEYNSHLVNYL